MAQGNYYSQALELLVLTCASIGLSLNVLSLLFKLIREFSIPKLWKYSILTNDFANVFLGIGLILFCVYEKTGFKSYCDAAGFFVQFGIFDCVCGFLTAGIILLGIYNPGKSSQISSFHRNVFLVIIIPQKILSIILSVLPAIPITYFTQGNNFSVTCYKISKPGNSADKFGVLIVFITWITIFIATTTFVIGSLKLWKGFNNRIHAASPNVWQAQLVCQGKSLQKFLLIEDCFWIIQLFIVTTVVYTNTDNENAATWIVYVSLAITTLIHAVLSVIQDIMWTSCCCGSSTAVEDPQRKLKRLELLKIEAPGKLRLRVWWNLGKSRALRRGMMKVYEKQHLKAWAQEIVVLGMLRKAQHPSLLQCLWTSGSNPYYDTMTLITGEVINSDSRIICLELTNSGTLQDFLHHLDTPLPESCQRMIVHDIAEGLSHLHGQNILHSNLTSACVYLKGSLNSMVIRAAIGDFEESQIYGSLQQNSKDVDLLVDKNQFFLPDIRSFALVALEIVSKMCEKKYNSLQYEWELDKAMSAKYPNYKSPYNEGEILHHYENDSDTDAEVDNMFYNSHRVKRLPKGVRSPAEVIQEVERRSRSHSPGSRPMSAQSIKSNKSRSRTLSPETSRGHSKPYRNSSTRGTPDADVISPEDEYPTRVMSPNHLIHNRSRPMSPENSKYEQNRSRSPKIHNHHGRHRSMSPETHSLHDRHRSMSPETSRPTQRSRPMSPEYHQTNRSMSPLSAERPLSPKCKSPARSDSAKGKRPRTPLKNSQNDNDKDPQVFEAFAPDAKKSKHKSVKKIDSKKWLQKPTSFIKSLTGAETSVSVFKSKSESKNDSAEEISDEEIETRADKRKAARKARRDSVTGSSGDFERPLHRTESRQSDQWSILSDMEYRHHGLKNTLSADSRSSMWSNLPLPLETIDIEGGGEMDDFGELVGSLPGMTDPMDFSRTVPSVNELLQAKQNGEKSHEYWRYDGPGPSQFELVDYYDELKKRYVKRLIPKGYLHRTASGTQILKAPVHRTLSGTQVLHRTCSGLQEIIEQTEYSNDEDAEDRYSPTQAEIDESRKILRKAESMKCERSKPVKKIKAKLLKEKNRERSRSRSRSRERNDSKDRRPDTPRTMETKDRDRSRSKERKDKSSEKKGKINTDNSQTKPVEVTKPIIKDKEMVRPLTADETAHKRARARKALNKAIAGNGKSNPVLPLQRSFRREKSTLEVKYASVKKIQRTNSTDSIAEGKPEEHQQKDLIDLRSSAMTPVENSLWENKDALERGKSPSPRKACDDPTPSHSNVQENVKKPVNVKRYASFSSNDSSSSIASSVRLRKADVSLTSGELTSLSSQADPDTDDHGTDVDLPRKEALLRKTMQNRSRFVDSGFDSESSEMSSDIYGHHTYFSSDDSAYVDIRDRVPPNKIYPKVSINLNSPVKETAFVLTGINSEKCLSPINSVSSTKQDISPDMEVDNLPDSYQTVEEMNEAQSSKSRIIEVLTAPIPVKSITVKSLDDSTSLTNDTEAKSRPRPPVPPKPTHLARPKTPLIVHSSSRNEQQQRNPSVNRPMTPGLIPRPKTPHAPILVKATDKTQRPKTPVVKRPGTPGAYSRPKTPITLVVSEKAEEFNDEVMLQNDTEKQNNETQNDKSFDRQNSDTHYDLTLETQNSEILETMNGEIPQTQNGEILIRKNDEILEQQDDGILESQISELPPQEHNLVEKTEDPERPLSPGAVEESSPSESSKSRPKTPPRKDSHLQVKGPNVYASPTQASKRYRELTMKGVPLRVSVISADDPIDKRDQEHEEEGAKNEQKENKEDDNMTDDQKLFDHLESHGFFHTKEKKDKLKLPGIYPTHHTSRKEQHQRAKRQRPPRLALDEIIRETPEEGLLSPNQRSPKHGLFPEDSFHTHSGEETATMLNQPASSLEDSETASIQASSVANSNHNSPQRPISPYSGLSPPSNQPAVVVDAELYIDRIYSKNQPYNSLERKSPSNRQVPSMSDPDFDMPVQTDRHGNPMMQLQLNPKLANEYLDEEDEEMEVDVPLLIGVDDRHVKGCQKLTQEMQLVSFNDLLPASDRSFEMLKVKLHQGGQLGTIGTQILDIIHTCWLSELPPSSSDLVTQLIDPVTETEL